MVRNNYGLFRLRVEDARSGIQVIEVELGAEDLADLLSSTVSTRDIPMTVVQSPNFGRTLETKHVGVKVEYSPMADARKKSLEVGAQMAMSSNEGWTAETPHEWNNHKVLSSGEGWAVYQYRMHRWIGEEPVEVA